jgi:hypothetical protein
VPDSLHRHLASSKALSPQLFEELQAFHLEFVKKPMMRAIMMRKYGTVAELPHASLLDDVRTIFLGLPEPFRPDDVLQRIGQTLADRIQQNDAEFFQSLSIILRTRRMGQSVSSIPRKKLCPSTGRGRKSTPHDLSVAVPWAVHRILWRRNRYFMHECLGNCISRDELKIEIAFEQGEGGLAEPTLISETELSRWITKMGIEKFMGPR